VAWRGPAGLTRWGSCCTADAIAIAPAPVPGGGQPDTLPDVIWDSILRLCSRKDHASMRLTCRAWHVQASRCLPALHLKAADACVLAQAASIFPAIGALKITAPASAQPVCLDVQQLHGFTRCTGGERGGGQPAEPHCTACTACEGERRFRGRGWTPLPCPQLAG